MAILYNPTITTAGTTTSSVYQLRCSPAQSLLPSNIIVQKLFTYGSGGTSVDTYIQTSIDGGTTWADVVHFAQNTTSSDTGGRPFITNISSLSIPTSPGNPIQTTDGTMTANNTNSTGIFGPLWRVKVVSVGTYAGGTTLRVDSFCNGLVPSS